MNDIKSQGGSVCQQVNKLESISVTDIHNTSIPFILFSEVILYDSHSSSFFFFLVTDPISMLGSHNLNNQATLVYNQNKIPSTKWINPVYTNNSYVHKLEPRTHTEEYDSTGNYSYTSIAPF